MSMKPTVADYPLAETAPERIAGRRGNKLAGITMEKVLAGEVSMEDLAITPAALQMQAAIARDAGRPMLARNFERAAELVEVPQDVIMRVYEMLRPGRATSKQELLDAAHSMRHTYGAEAIADFIAEAAEVYERRGLFVRRF